MAENETLDLGDRRNRRWRVLCDRVLSGVSAAEAAADLVRCVRGTLSRILRHDHVRGGPEFPLGELLTAMQRGEAERDAVLAQCQGHQYAHLLAEEPCRQDSETIMSSHCRAISGKFLDQIELEAMPTRFASFSESLTTCDVVAAWEPLASRSEVAEVVRRISRSARYSPSCKEDRYDWWMRIASGS